MSMKRFTMSLPALCCTGLLASSAAGQAEPANTASMVITEAELQTAQTVWKDAQGAVKVVEFLKKAGLASEDWQHTSVATVGVVERLQGNLDMDADLESVLHLRLDGLPPVPLSEWDGTPQSTERHYLVWLDGHAAGLRALGVHAMNVSSCIVEGSLSVKLEAVHRADVKDTIVTWTDAPTCNGNFQATVGTKVIALERGRVDTLLDFAASGVSERNSGKTIVEQKTIRFLGSAPKSAQIVAKEKVIGTYRFDPIGFTYTDKAPAKAGFEMAPHFAALFELGRTFEYDATWEATLFGNPEEPGADASGIVKNAGKGTLSCTVKEVVLEKAFAASRVTCTDEEAIDPQCRIDGVYVATPKKLSALAIDSALPRNKRELDRIATQTELIQARPTKVSRHHEDQNGFTDDYSVTSARGGWCVASAATGGDSFSHITCYEANRGIASMESMFEGGVSKSCALQLRIK
jgi:hypothetical protein